MEENKFTFAIKNPLTGEADPLFSPVESLDSELLSESQARFNPYNVDPQSLMAAFGGTITGSKWTPPPTPEPVDDRWEYYFKRGDKCFLRRDGQKLAIIDTTFFNKLKYGTKFQISQPSIIPRSATVPMPNGRILDLTGVELPKE